MKKPMTEEEAIININKERLFFSIFSISVNANIIGIENCDMIKGLEIVEIANKENKPIAYRFFGLKSWFIVKNKQNNKLRKFPKWWSTFE